MEKPPLVLIEWEDSAQPVAVWQYLDEIETPKVVQCQSVGFLIHASNRGRQNRVTALINICSVAYCGMGLKKIIGIATEPLTVKERSYDVIIFDDVRFENHKELEGKMGEFFGKPVKHSETEFGGKE